MGRHASVEPKKVPSCLPLINGYQYKKIRKTTAGTSERTTQRLCALHRRTGDVVQRRIVDGQPQILNGSALSVDGNHVVRQVRALTVCRWAVVQPAGDCTSDSIPPLLPMGQGSLRAEASHECEKT
jgi:hypothetical protein